MSRDAMEMTVVRRCFDELLNRGALDRFTELMAPEVEVWLTSVRGRASGASGVGRLVGALHAAIPDLRFAIGGERVEGIMASCNWVLGGTHAAEVLGIEPSGRRVVRHGVALFRFDGGRVRKLWISEDGPGLLTKIGEAVMSSGALAEGGAAPGEAGA